MTLPIGEPRAGARRVVRRRFVPQNVGRMKVALPNGLTLGNLFFGINAIIAASRGNFNHACLFVVLGGVCDAFDGAAARATRTGGRFGEELDSLVDAISFGLAPAMIVHFSTLAAGQPGWNVAVFVFAACAVMRLARFNITQAGGSKTYFQGLPSPAAGGTLATYWWFSQTSFYQNNAAIVDLPWNLVMQGLMLALGFLMVSDVPYPAWPKIGLRSWKGVLGLAGMLFLVFGIAYWRSAFFFPFGIAYVTYGLVRMLLLGMWERRPRRDAYTGAPLPRRGTARSGTLLPPDVEELDASDLMDPDDLVEEEEYDFFEDEEEAPARPARASGAVRAARPEGSERSAERIDRADRAERLEKRKKRKRKERLEQRAAQERPERGEARDEARPARGAAPSEQSAPDGGGTTRPDGRAPRPPRPAREPARSERPDRPGLAEAATVASTEGDDLADLDAGDDSELARGGTARTDSERRKRRKRRRGGRAAGDGPATMDVAPDAASGADGGRATHPLPVTPPFSGPAPAPVTPPPTPPATPATLAPPPAAPSSSFDPREDRSE